MCLQCSGRFWDPQFNLYPVPWFFLKGCYSSPTLTSWSGLEFHFGCLEQSNCVWSDMKHTREQVYSKHSRSWDICPLAPRPLFTFLTLQLLKFKWIKIKWNVHLATFQVLSSHIWLELPYSTAKIENTPFMAKNLIAQCWALTLSTHSLLFQTLIREDFKCSHHNENNRYLRWSICKLDWFDHFIVYTWIKTPYCANKYIQQFVS
jgi:hypothetical protein